MDRAVLRRIKQIQRQLATTASPAAAAETQPPPLQFSHWYTHAEVGTFFAELTASYPTLCSVGSTGTSREGRAIQSLTVSAGNNADLPVYLVYGTIHAGELSGIHACLHTALALCADHVPADKKSLLNRVTFTIIPQISPDGADWCAKTSGSVRSIPHDPTAAEPNVLYPGATFPSPQSFSIKL